jgi:hypothetical protein
MYLFFLPHVLNVPIQTASPFDMYSFSLLTYIILKISEDIVFLDFWENCTHYFFNFGPGNINFEINLTVNYKQHILYKRIIFSIQLKFSSSKTQSVDLVII